MQKHAPAGFPGHLAPARQNARAGELPTGYFKIFEIFSSLHLKTVTALITLHLPIKYSFFAIAHFEVLIMCPSGLRTYFFVLLAVSASAPAARADVMFFNTGAGFQSQLNALGIKDQNVLFNGKSPPEAHGPALTVTGATNQTGTLVDISSSVSLTGSGGQADGVVAAANGKFGDATIAYHDGKTNIQSLYFNLDNANGKLETNTQVEFTVTFADKDGKESTKGVVNNGNNIFAVIAFNGDSIVNATVNVLFDPSLNKNVLEQLYQIRISPADGTSPPPGGAGDGPVHMPEPASWLVWGTFFIGALLIASRKRWQPEPIRIRKPGKR